MAVRDRQSHKQCPPVVYQRRHSGYQPTTLVLLRGKTTPIPVVFEFIKVILTVSLIAIGLNLNKSVEPAEAVRT